MARVSRRTLLAAMAATVRGGALPREPAPKFTAKTVDGEKLNNEALKGRVVLLQFWATWCSFCRRDQPAVDTLVHDFAEKGLVVLAVNVGESRKKVTQYLEQSPRACKIVLMEDTNLAAIFAAKSYPFYVLIDKDGSVAGTQSGSGGEHALRGLLRKAGLKAD